MRKILIIAIVLSSLHVKGQNENSSSPENVTNLGPVQNLQDYGFTSQATADFYSGFRYRWGGMGLMYGIHVVSPVVYMYETSGYGRNSFIVGSLPYNGGDVLPTSDIKPLFVVKNNGNVGIGNVTPDYKLSVVGSVAVGLDQENDEEYGSLVIKKNIATDHYASFGFNNGSLTSNNKWDALTITRSGKVGIRDRAPSSELDVSGGINAAQYFVNGQAVNFDQSITSPWAVSGSNIAFGGNRVGIAKTDPAYTLDVSGIVNASEIRINGQILDLTSANLWDTSGNDIQYNTGKVGINTTNLVGDYSLFVRDGIITEKVVVEVEGEWPDYVFQPAYKLPSLKEVSNYIQQHKHLPEVPSAAKIAAEGLNLGEMEALMMKKIEELTLYAIEQEREKEALKIGFERLQRENKEKDSKIDNLQSRLDKLEKMIETLIKE